MRLDPFSLEVQSFETDPSVDDELALPTEPIRRRASIPAPGNSPASAARNHAGGKRMRR